MTQDKPERVKEMPERLRDQARGPFHHRRAHPERCLEWAAANEIERLRTAISLSEKRAEEAEAETLSLMMDAVELRSDLERAISERNSSQASLLRVEEALKPFAGCVFNDNGDMTVTRSDIQAEHFIKAYFAIRTALSPHKET